MVSTWLNSLVSGTVPPDAWTALQSSTLGSDTAEVTFTSAGSAKPWSLFQDLVLISYGRSTESAAASYGRIFLNNDTTAGNYPWQSLYGDGSSVTAASGTGDGYIQGGFFPAASAGPNMFGVNVVSLFDINDTAKYTSALSQSAADTDGSGYVSLDATTWESTVAVTEIDIKLNNANNILAASRFDLFGVAA